MNAPGAETAADARCALHVDRKALGICERCGSYHCGDCVQELGGRKLCSACLAIPGIDYLAEARAKAWGKRDSWVWYLGFIGALGSTLVSLVSLSTGNIPHGVGALLVAALMACYFFMLPWSRKALFAAIPMGAVNGVLGAPPHATESVAYYAGAGCGSSLFFGLLVMAAYASTRNKLAFKLELSDRELADYYDKYVSNPDAKRALAYGVLSLLVPLTIPIALVFGVRALRRFKPNAWPPVRHRGSAVTGLACAGLSTLLWSGFMLAAAMR